MKEFFKNIFEVICYIGLLIGGIILCFIAIIPVFAIIFFSVAGTLVYDLLRIMDGKGKKKSKAVDEVKDSQGNKVSQYYNTDFRAKQERMWKSDEMKEWNTGNNCVVKFLAIFIFLL